MGALFGGFPPVATAIFVQRLCEARCNSIMTNRNESQRRVDPEFSRKTPAWMDKWGPDLVARHLTDKVFKVDDWYVDELLVRYRSLPYVYCSTSHVCISFVRTNRSNCWVSRCLVSIYP